MRNVMARRWLPFAALAALLFLGCGGPKNYPVRGKVVFQNDGRPLRGGTVLFERVEEPKEQASGELDDDGLFELGNTRGLGAIPGEYQVLLEPPPSVSETGRLPYDSRYLRFETSGLTYTLQPKDNELEIRIDRATRP